MITVIRDGVPVNYELDEATNTWHKLQIVLESEAVKVPDEIPSVKRVGESGLIEIRALDFIFEDGDEIYLTTPEAAASSVPGIAEGFIPPVIHTQEFHQEGEEEKKGDKKRGH